MSILCAEMGIIYFVFGCVEKYWNLVHRSLLSVRQHLPGVPATLFTDQPGLAKGFDSVLTIPFKPEDARLGKIESMLQSPYQRTLFLDADTIVVGDISELFVLLEHFDLGAVHSGARDGAGVMSNVPSTFPEYNSGVIVFRRCRAVEDMLNAWKLLYLQCRVSYPKWANRKTGLHPDQPAFRAALYASRVRVATVPPEFNCRGHVGYLDGPIRLIHRSRSFDLAEFAAQLNEWTGSRIYRNRTIHWAAGRDK